VQGQRIAKNRLKNRRARTRITPVEEAARLSFASASFRPDNAPVDSRRQGAEAAARLHALERHPALTSRSPTKEDESMRKLTIGLATAALLAYIGPARSGDGKTGLNDEGFITTWLLLAPIPLKENQSGADALNEEHIKGEAKLQPKAGDKVKVGNKELVWKEHKVKEYFFDFNDFLGQQTEDSVGFAVCYIHADAKMPNIKLKTGSDDQAKVYLNGKEILKQDQARSQDKDQDTTDVTLEKGVNVLVFKVVNEKVDWSGCARFTDKDGKVIKNLKVTTTPK
jgi:hypothetical protein